MFRKKGEWISWYFFNLGMLVGNYVSRLPSIKEDNRLSDGELGLVLLACALGTMICLPFVSRFNSSFGSGISTFLSSIGTAVVTPLIGIYEHKHAKFTLYIGMLSIGFGMGFADVSANAQAVLIEAQAGRPYMGLFHAAYASGSFIGALLGGAFAEAGISPFTNIFIVSAFSMFGSLFFFPTLYSNMEEKDIYKKIEATNKKNSSYDKRDDVKKSLTFFGINRSLFFISIIGFVAYMAEGSVEDWTTVYYKETLNATPLMCSFGFAVFALAIAVGRYLSDGLVQRFGSVRLLQLSGSISSIGLIFVVIASFLPDEYKTIIATISLAVSGAGLSLASPIVSSSAGRVPGMLPSESLSFVTSFAYTGYFIGPPLFGGLAELLGGLKWSLLIDAFLISIIALAAHHIPEDAQYKSTMKGENNLDSIPNSSSKGVLLINSNHLDDMNDSDM